MWILGHEPESFRKVASTLIHFPAQVFFLPFFFPTPFDKVLHSQDWLLTYHEAKATFKHLILLPRHPLGAQISLIMTIYPSLRLK